MTLFQCKRCLRFFVPDTEADDGGVIPGHPMKVLVSAEQARGLRVEKVDPFFCDLEDCVPPERAAA